MCRQLVGPKYMTHARDFALWTPVGEAELPQTPIFDIPLYRPSAAYAYYAEGAGYLRRAGGQG